MEQLKDLIRTIPDFPKKGILYRDITTLLQDAAGFRAAVDKMCDPFLHEKIDVIAGIESRGFIFGSSMAVLLGTKFVPIRKKGKLPFTTVEETYDLEYGTNTIEIHTDAIIPGERVLIVDDLLATGGTVQAAVHLVEKQGGAITGVCVLVELLALGARQKIDTTRVHSVITYSD